MSGVVRDRESGLIFLFVEHMYFLFLIQGIILFDHDLEEEFERQALFDNE
jgi:hypothetical protein